MLEAASRGWPGRGRGRDDGGTKERWKRHVPHVDILFIVPVSFETVDYLI